MEQYTRPYYFESSCYKTPQFITFSKAFRKWIKSQFKTDEIKISVWHFHISWFIKREDKHIYFSISDVRPRWDGRILYRTAENDKDFHWWRNRYTNIFNIARDINLLFNNYAE